MRERITHLAIPPRLDHGVLRAMFQSDAPIVLDEARRLGFISSSPDGDLEIHPLLRSYLRNRLESEFSPPKVRLDSLLTHLIAHNRWDEAFAVIVDYMLGARLLQMFSVALVPLVEQGRLATIEQWIIAARQFGLDDPILDLADAEIMFVQGKHEIANA